MQIQRGDIFYADLYGRSGSVQHGKRPVVVLQNNKGNAHAPTTLIAPLTSQRKKKYLPTHVLILADQVNGLSCDSVALLEQVQTVNKDCLGHKLGHLTDMCGIDRAIRVSLGLAD